MKDDRDEFQANRHRQSLALGQDKAVFEQSKQMLLNLDSYDYSYLWNWFGAPIIQMPADVMATQEVIFATQPDIIIETGVARGGSILFMASLCQLLGKGKVIGVDIDIRAHNRQTIENHPLKDTLLPRIQLVEGSSVAPETIETIKRLIPDEASVMVVLDSNHARDHVLAELRAYGPLVTKGCYMVVADTLVGHCSEDETPQKRSQILFKGNDPLSARDDYLSETDRFEVDEALNGKLMLSSSPGGYLHCVRD
jgi:cephalosporin hydroxylase